MDYYKNNILIPGSLQHNKTGLELWQHNTTGAEL